MREGGRRYGEGRAQVSRPLWDLTLTLNGIGKHWRVELRSEVNGHVLKDLQTTLYNELQKDKGKNRKMSLESIEVVQANSVLSNSVEQGR